MMTQPELCNFRDDGRLYTFSNVPAAAAAGIARRSQLNKSCKGRQHGPSVTVQITPAGPTLLQFRRAGCRVGPVLCTAFGLSASTR
jgi:hypothetical protein